MFYDEELPYITTYDVAGTVAKHGWGIGATVYRVTYTPNLYLVVEIETLPPIS